MTLRSSLISSYLQEIVISPAFITFLSTRTFLFRSPFLSKRIVRQFWGISYTEPVFADLFRRSGIDFQPGGPVRQPYFSYRPVRLHRLAKSIPRNWFLGSINFYKYGLGTVPPPPPPLSKVYVCSTHTEQYLKQYIRSQDKLSWRVYWNWQIHAQ